MNISRRNFVTALAVTPLLSGWALAAEGGYGFIENWFDFGRQYSVALAIEKNGEVYRHGFSTHTAQNVKPSAERIALMKNELRKWALETHGVIVP